MGITLRDGNIITPVISSGSQTPTPTPVEEYDPLVYTLSSDGTYYIIGTGYGSIDDIINDNGTFTNGSGLKSDYKENYKKSSINIPAMHDNLPVKAIAARAFWMMENIKSIYIEDGEMTTIARQAMIGNPYLDSSILQEVHLPDTLTYLGERALSQNVKLLAIDIPDSLQELKSLTFAFCFNLSSIHFNSESSKLKSIQTGVFYDTNISTIELPGSVQDINIDNGFIWKTSHSPGWGVSDLHVSSTNSTFTDAGFNCIINKNTQEIIAGCKYSFPDNQTYLNNSEYKEISIGTYAFGSVTFPPTRTFVLPDVVKVINKNAFDGATFKAGLKWPQQNVLTTIHDDAFYEAEIVGDVILPGSIVTLGSAFQKTTFNNSNIDLPNSITVVPFKCFNIITISGSGEIRLPVSITSIDALAFANIDSTFTLRYLGTMDQWRAITKHPNWKLRSLNLTDVVCSDGSLFLSWDTAETWILNESIPDEDSPTLDENNGFIVEKLISSGNKTTYDTIAMMSYCNSIRKYSYDIQFTNDWESDITNRTIHFFNPVDLTSEFGQWLQSNGVKQQ